MAGVFVHRLQAVLPLLHCWLGMPRGWESSFTPIRSDESYDEYETSGKVFTRHEAPPYCTELLSTVVGGTQNVRTEERREETND